jgi:hypothetical protein
VLCESRKRAANPDAKVGRPGALTKAQEDEIVQLILTDATQGKSMKKGELLDLVEKLYGKILTYGCVYCFLDRHRDLLSNSTLHPQEDPRL